jgi:hypothetical protein
MKGRHRAKPEHRVANGWLGAGAVTLGVGAALASGSGVAHAEGTASDGTGGAPSSSASSASSTASEGHSTPQAVASHVAKPSESSQTPKTTHRSSSTKRPTATGANTGNGATGTTPTPSTAPPSTESPVAAAHHVVKDAVAVVHPAVTVSPSAVRTATAPRVALASAAAQTPVAVLPAAATPVAPALPRNPVEGLLTEVVAAVNTLIAPNPAVPPSNPLQLLAFEVVRRVEISLHLPVVGTPVVSTPDPVIGTNPVSTSFGVPSPGDVADTPYGEIGKWLLQPNGQISNYGGQKFAGKSILEPVNVIILDPTSASAADAAKKLNTDLSQAGFPAQPIHSTGFLGIIDGETFAQHPTGLLAAYSDANFLLPDDHARVFGPAPAQSEAGYVWTVATSRELFGLNGLIPAHTYVSYDQARDELTSRLIANGATLVGIVPLSNAYSGATETTGDNDGYAIVIKLND